MTKIISSRIAPPTANASSDKTGQMFELDALFDALVSGRLCGRPVPPDVAQILVVLLERLEWDPDPRRLAGALPHYSDTFGINEIRSTVASLGFPSEFSRMTGRQLANCPAATLVADNDGRLWLIRHTQPGIELVQPGELEESVRSVGRSQFYYAIRFEQHSDLTQATRPEKLGQFSWTEQTISRFVPEMRLMLVLTLLSGILAISIAFGIIKIFDTVIPTRNHATLAGILAGMGLVLCIDFSFRRIRADLVGRVSGRLEFILGSALLGKLLHLPASMLSGVSLSDQLARLRQFESIRDLFGGPFVLLILELPLAVLFLAAVAVIAWPLAVVLAAYAALSAALAIFLAPAIRRESRKQGAALGILNRVVLEVLEQRRQIAREGLAPIWVAKADAKARDLARSRRRLNALTRWLAAISHISLPLAAASTIGLGALLVMQGNMTGGALVAATILTWRLFAPVQQALQLLPKLQDVVGLFNQIDTLMRLPEEESGSSAGHLIEPAGHLEAQGVAFRHPKSIVPTLAGIRLDISHGDFVAVTGKSGSGKTTLLRVLAGQLAPQAGTVLFNDLNLTQLSQAFRARNIAFVSQQPLFFYGSVAQNLRLADPSANDDRLTGIMAEVGLGDWVNALPDGMHTRLDPSGDGDLLSPGVLTGIALAQALLTNPAVLLLDEPAGNLDPSLEAHLVAALESRRGTMTIVVVTHRPSLMKRTDAVIFLNAGAAVMRATADLEKEAS
ncbi:MAG: ATP-binding cassette domain-containing protein [Silicimonas sp.]|nr:ATP-binding cassette domain-containing protein [Silicimonas sp.]